MELRSCRHLHFIQAIKGGLVTKVLNVYCGKPALSFKNVTDIYDGLKSKNDHVKAELSCIDTMEERPHNGDNQIEDDDFENLTLSQIKKSCKTRKRKRSPGLDSYTTKVKLEVLTSEDHSRKEQMAADDLDIVETDPISVHALQIIPFFKSEENENDQEQEFPPSGGGDSNALVVVKHEVYEEEAENEFNYGCYEFNYEWRKHADFIPLQTACPSCTSMDIVMCETELINDRSPNYLAIELVNEECISIPQTISDDDTDYNEDDNTVVAEVQGKPSSAIEHSLSPSGCEEYEEKQSFASVDNYEKRNVIQANSDELPSWDDQKVCSKLQRPKRLLSNRTMISPTAQKRIREAMQSFDSNHDKNGIMCRGKLWLDDQIDTNNGAVDGRRPRVTPKTLKRGSFPKRILQIPQSSCPAKSAITFSRKQMQDVESVAMNLTKEMKSLKDILNDMLRSEFCLNTSLRYKVNKAITAVKNATKAEDAAKRRLNVMSRDCYHFCKIMTLADGGPPAQQDVVRKKRKKIVFADEAGGSLCQVKLYEDDAVSLKGNVESDRSLESD